MTAKNSDKVTLSYYIFSNYVNIFIFSFIVDPVITYTPSIGAVRKPHLPGGESVYLFLEFTIIVSYQFASQREFSAIGFR